MAILAVVAVPVLAFVAWYEVSANPFGGPGKAVIVNVRSGEPTGQVIDDLAARGVVSSGLAFRISDMINGAPDVLPGGYLAHQNSSFGAVRALLGGGPNIHSVTVVPGFLLSEVATQVGEVPGHGAGEFLSAARSGVVTSPFLPAGSTSLQGLLGAGTYQVLPGETDQQLLQAMVDRFDAQAAQAGLTPASAAALGLTPYQVITAASIVQKEGFYPKNMPQVARVVYNRIASGTPLQMDSTVLFSLGRDGGPVTAADLKLDTPYNTYLHAGLTPTPICVPSVTALRAAVSPPPGPWKFFVVVKKDGTEAFATTFAEQLANEKLAQSRGLG